VEKSKLFIPNKCFQFVPSAGSCEISPWIKTAQTVVTAHVIKCQTEKRQCRQLHLNLDSINPSLNSTTTLHLSKTKADNLLKPKSETRAKICQVLRPPVSTLSRSPLQPSYHCHTEVLCYLCSAPGSCETHKEDFHRIYSLCLLSYFFQII
jgi:hypothetical protein